MPYDDQLERKRERVVAELHARASLREVEVEPCRAAPSALAYRNRAKLAVAADRRGVGIGLFARGSNRVVDLAPCVVQRDVVQAALEPLRAWLAEHSLARPDGPVIYADVRECIGPEAEAAARARATGCHLTLVVDGSDEDVARLPLEDLALRWPELTGVAVNFGSAESSYAMGAETRALRGPGRFRAPAYDLGGETLAFDVPAGGFFQVAPGLLDYVHERMLAHLGESGPLLDLYCGVGVHGIALALRGAACATSASAELVGVDDVEAAIECARSNARRLGVRAEMIHARVEEWLTDGDRGLLARETRVVLNPGRSGCRAPVLAALASVRPARIAYLSCNPATLARDLDVLVAEGITIAAVVPLDLMPQTDHVETLVLLES